MFVSFEDFKKRAAPFQKILNIDVGFTDKIKQFEERSKVY